MHCIRHKQGVRTALWTMSAAPNVSCQVILSTLSNPLDAEGCFGINVCVSTRPQSNLHPTLKNRKKYLHNILLGGSNAYDMIEGIGSCWYSEIQVVQTRKTRIGMFLRTMTARLDTNAKNKPHAK